MNRSSQALGILALGAVLAPCALVAAPPQEDCAPVEKFGEGLFSTGSWEWRLSFAPSRREAYWSVSAGFFPATREQVTIVTSRKHGRDSWSAAEVASFSGEHSDIDPFVSPDGRTLYFASMRPVNGEARNDMNVWKVERGPQGWGEPEYLGDAVNSALDELYPSVDTWGNLYFASDRSGQWDIYRSERLSDGGYAPAEALGPGVNTPDFWEFNPEISPDGRTLLFTSLNRPEGHGWGDLYVSHRGPDGEFLPAENLGPCVNTAADEYHPTVLWERGELYFVRFLFDPGGSGDFYRTRLPLPRGRGGSILD
jgi:hypothetical protein